MVQPLYNLYNPELSSFCLCLRLPINASSPDLPFKERKEKIRCGVGLMWGPQLKPSPRHLHVLLAFSLAASCWYNFFFTIQQVVLDGYLMTSMGLKEDLAGDRAEGMQEKNTSAGMFSGSESWDRLWY